MAERASPFADEILGAAEGVRMEALARGSVWQVAAWGGTFGDVESALAEACGCDAPSPGRAVPTADGRLLIRTGPLVWRIAGPDGADCPLKPEPDRGSWLDMGHDQAGLALAGPNAAEALKRLVPIDLREAAFPDLAFATTALHDVVVQVLRRDADGLPRYEISAGRSCADHLHGIVAQCLRRFGPAGARPQAANRP